MSDVTRKMREKQNMGEKEFTEMLKVFSLIFPHIITPIFTYSLGGEISDGGGEVFLFFSSQCLPLS